MGRGDVLVQQAQGRGARGTGEVELGKLAFGKGGNQRFIYNLTIYHLLFIYIRCNRPTVPLFIEGRAEQSEAEGVISVARSRYAPHCVSLKLRLELPPGSAVLPL